MHFWLELVNRRAAMLREYDFLTPGLERPGYLRWPLRGSALASRGHDGSRGFQPTAGFNLSRVQEVTKPGGLNLFPLDELVELRATA